MHDVSVRILRRRRQRRLVGNLIILVHEEHELLSANEQILWCEAVRLVWEARTVQPWKRGWHEEHAADDGLPF